MGLRRKHTGPVRVLNDLVDQVPTNSSGHFCVEGSPDAAAAAALKSWADERAKEESAAARL